MLASGYFGIESIAEKHFAKVLKCSAKLAVPAFVVLLRELIHSTSSVGQTLELGEYQEEAIDILSLKTLPS